MNVKKLIIAVAVIFLAIFLASYVYINTLLTEPLSVHITNTDPFPHDVSLKVYFNGKCIFSKNLTVKPKKSVVIGNIARTEGRYLLVITVDGKTYWFPTKVAFGCAGVSVFIRNSSVDIRQMMY